MGCEAYDFVACGNLLCARSVLLLWLACVCQIRWLLEQPHGSIIECMPRMQEFLHWCHVARHFLSDLFRLLSLAIAIIIATLSVLKQDKVYRGGFWMMNFGGPTAKRHLIFCNDSVIVQAMRSRGGHLSKRKAGGANQTFPGCENCRSKRHSPPDWCEEGLETEPVHHSCLELLFSLVLWFAFILIFLFFLPDTNHSKVLHMMTYCRNYTIEFGRFMASLLTAVTDKTFYPEPRDEGRPIDHTRTDWELFRKHCLDQDYNLVGDMWVDALASFIFLINLWLSFPASKIACCALQRNWGKNGQCLDYLVSSTGVMSNLPGTGPTWPESNIPATCQKMFGVFGLCWQCVPQK